MRMDERSQQVDRCVSCGEIVPEGRQVCPVCELCCRNCEHFTANHYGCRQTDMYIFGYCHCRTGHAVFDDNQSCKDFRRKR
jgi:RNA polymerase subunit RPABC4/transcription elongation factor Spt4